MVRGLTDAAGEGRAEFIRAMPNRKEEKTAQQD